MKFSIILAVDDKNGLGRKNDLAWKLSADLKYFRNITSKTTDLAKMNAVVMGRKTRDSIPVKYRPLPQRINCILTRKIKNDDIGSPIDDFVLYFNSFEHCLSELEGKENVENIFIVGGANLYNQVLDNPMLDKIYLTKVKGNYNCDVFFDGIPDDFIVDSYTDLETENGIEYSFWVYKKQTNEAVQKIHANCMDFCYFNFFENKNYFLIYILYIFLIFSLYCLKFHYFS